MKINIKSFFLADPGHIFVDVDLSQVEARIVAFDAEDVAYMQIFDSGGDIHKRNASNIFGIPEDQITKHQRYLGKKVSHATNYGMGPKTMCESIIKELGTDYAISLTDARRFQQNYHLAYPGVALWQEAIRDQLKKDRTLTNCFNRSRYFMGPWNDKLFKEAYAFGPQSTAVQILNLGLLEWEEIHKGRFPVVAQVHDSVLIQWPENYEIDIAMIKEVFEREIEIKGRQITVPVGIKAGPTWGTLEEIC